MWSPVGQTVNWLSWVKFSPNFPGHLCCAAAGGFTPPPLESVELGFQILSGRWTRTIQSREAVGGQGGNLALMMGKGMNGYLWVSYFREVGGARNIPNDSSSCCRKKEAASGANLL